MKALRGLYLAAVYILGAPISVAFMIVILAIDIVWCIRDGLGIGDLRGYLAGIFEAMRDSHKLLIYWVKYGKNYTEKYLEEGLI